MRQFISAYKKLLVRCQIRDNGIGNCISLEDIDVLHTLPKIDSISEINNSLDRMVNIEKTDINGFTEGEQEFLIAHKFLMEPESLSEYVSKVVEYIAGFVVKKIQKHNACVTQQ